MNPIPIVFPLVFAGALALTQTPRPLTLEQALATARDHRPSVRSAQLRVEQAQHQKRSLTAPLPARLDIQATSNRELYGNDDDIAISQPIDLFGRRKANRSLGDAQIQFAQATLRQTLAEVQGEVIDRFSEAAYAAQLVRTARAQVEIAERLLDATRRRTEGGALPAVQIKRANLELERAKQTLALREANARAARRRLAGAMGLTENDASVSEFPAIPVAPMDEALLARQRPDLLQLSAQFAVAEANIGLSRVQFHPDLEISARTSPYGYGPSQPAGLRATLSIPIFDYGRARNEIKASQLSAEAERKALDDAIAKAKTELEAVNVELEAANAQREAFGRLLEETRELLRVSEVGYREGATSLLEVIEATRSLREVEESLVEVKLRVAQAQAAYLRTTGALLEVNAR